MHAFDAENQMNRRKAETKAAGDAYMQLADFDRPRRRFFLGALLAAFGRLRRRADELPSVMASQQKADQTF